jgi:hypothetical protein
VVSNRVGGGGVEIARLLLPGWMVRAAALQVSWTVIFPCAMKWSGMDAHVMYRTEYKYLLSVHTHFHPPWNRIHTRT